MDIVSRVKNILVTPKTEWAVIAGERTPLPALYTGYICILAAIPAVSMLIGRSLLGPLPISWGIRIAVISYVIGLAMVVLVGFIAAKLAPTFGGQDDMDQALKLVAYSYTPAWVAGIFHLIPGLGIVATIAGLYSLYLLYLGIPPLMKSPDDKAVVYTVAIIVIAIVLTLVLGMVLGGILLGGGMMM